MFELQCKCHHSCRYQSAFDDLKKLRKYVLIYNEWALWNSFLNSGFEFELIKNYFVFFTEI